MAWDPKLYGRFAAPRLRPALALLSGVPELEARRIIDLGCGSGVLMGPLTSRWPEATVTGVDSSEEMLTLARQDHPAADWPQVAWVNADIKTWKPQEPPDLIVSKAALHWVGDHDLLLPRLLDSLAEGGVLAIQVPGNFEEPSHRIIRDATDQGPWRGRVPTRPAGILEPRNYHDLLAPQASTVEIWETIYHHVLTGPDPVFEWLRGSALRPVLAALNEGEIEPFEALCRNALAQAYPPRPDGSTLFPFRRVFIVARR